MSDFMDRLGDQLHAAQHAAPPAARAGRPTAQPWRRGSRRGLLAVAAVLALAAPAVALVTPWDPDLERTGVDKPVSTDPAPVSGLAVDVLAPLRRQQTADDRRIATPLIRTIGTGNQVDRVQSQAIRAVAPGWALVPAKAVKSGPTDVSSDQLCLTDGKTVSCSPASDFAKNGVGIMAASKTHTSFTGLVPDNVVGVRFKPTTGTAVEVETEGNFYALSVSETAPSGRIKAPEGYNGPSTIPGPPMPISGALQWLNRDGEVVGPSNPGLG